MTYNRFQQDPAAGNYMPVDQPIQMIEKVDHVDVWVGRIRDFLSAIGIVTVFVALCFLAGYYGG